MWQIASVTGWTDDYIMNKVNYQTLIMMLADAPRYVKKAYNPPSDEEEEAMMQGFFQSEL